MYLSQLNLNPRTRRVQREVSNPYEMHRTIMRAFPSQDEGGPGRVLFRVEQPSRSGSMPLTLLVQSEKQPDWHNLAETNGYRLSDAGDQPTIRQNPKSYHPSFRAGQRLYFRLRANPTIKRKFEGEAKSKRVGLYKEEEQRAWLERKAEQGGFRILTAQVMAEGRVFGKIHHPQETKRHNLNLLAVRFDGLLHVIDPDLFLATLRQGIGSGKGLGFGLLSVARFG